MARPEFEPQACCSPRRGFYLFGQRQLSSRCAPMLSCDPHLTCLYCRCCCCCYTFAHRSLGLPSDACSEFVGARGSRRGDSKVEKSRVAFKRSFTIAALLMYLRVFSCWHSPLTDRARASLAERCDPGSSLGRTHPLGGASTSSASGRWLLRACRRRALACDPRSACT